MAVITLPFRPSAPGRLGNGGLGPYSANPRVHSLDFLFECPPAESIQAIAPTAFLSPFLALDSLNPPLIQQALKRAVERARPQTDLTIGLAQDFFRDAVAMAIASSQRGENVEH
jgi:hypothetical protein